LPKNYFLSDIEFIPLYIKLVPFLITLLGGFTAYFIYRYYVYIYFELKQTDVFKFVYLFLNKKWYFDKAYNAFINQNILLSSYTFFYKTVDRGILEILGPFGLTNLIPFLSNHIRFMQTGFVLHYLIYICVAILCFIFFSLKQSIVVILIVILSFSFMRSK